MSTVLKLPITVAIQHLVVHMVTESVLPLQSIDHHSMKFSSSSGDQLEYRGNQGAGGSD